jgi:signal transduction histidine kinase
MRITRKLSTRLLLGNVLVVGIGGIAFSITFRLLASEIFDDRIRRGGQGGPAGGGQGLLEAFSDSVDIALLVSMAVGVVVAAVVAFFVAKAMSKPIARIRETTRAIAGGDYAQRVEAAEVIELDALGQDVNRLAQTLEATEQRRASLLSDVTHELRTPLASIDGFVEGAVDGVFTTDEMFVAVTEETARLLRLVEDLSVLSKTTEHSLSLDLAPVHLSEVVTAAVEQLRPQYAERSVMVGVEAKADPEVTGDENKLRQVIVNLLSNALGHVDDGGGVRVVIDETTDSATVSVIDDGEGIRPEDLERVFDRFFRGSSAHKRAGTGLGLAVARGIAEAHGGALTAASDGPGAGATFTLTMPRV